VCAFFQMVFCDVHLAHNPVELTVFYVLHCVLIIVYVIFHCQFYIFIIASFPVLLLS
jgi:hypothetical protein